MATLEKIRKNGVLIAVIIGIALLAFILGDFLTGKSGIFKGSQTKTGEISGKSISIQTLEQKFIELEAKTKLESGKSSLDEAETEKIKESAWQQIVYENVFEKEFERLGLTVSPDELYDLMSGPNPHPSVRRLFTNPETGEFNRNMLMQFLKGTNENQNSEQMTFRLYLEDDIKTDRVRVKYFNLISKGVSVPTFLAKNAYLESNKKVDFKYVAVRLSSVSDSSISVSPSDLKKYYNDHKYLYYNTSTTRDIEYVSFDVLPSKEDTADTKETVEKLKPAFALTTEVESFVNGKSDDQYADKNYTEKDLPDSLKTPMFKGAVGNVFGPYFENGAFKLARLYKILSLPDSIKARHILILPKANTQEDVTKAKNLADSLKKMIDKGAEFDALAKQYSDDKNSASKGGDLGWFNEVKMPQLKQLCDTAFFLKKGEIKSFITNYGFEIVQVFDRGKEQKKVKVAILTRKIEPSDQTQKKVFAIALKFASENRTLDDFNKAVTKQNLAKKIATEIEENARNIPGFGAEKPRALLEWIYQANKNEISEPIAIGNSNIVAVLTEIREKGTAPLQQVKTNVQMAVQKEKKLEKLVEKMNNAKSGVNSILDLSLKLKAGIDTANNISFASTTYSASSIPEPKLFAYTYSYPAHKLSQPVTGNYGVYVVEIINITEAPETKDYSMTKQQLENNLQQETSYGVSGALIKLADIVDHRLKFHY
jgi:peptidyl-prolyl cis-trans isomerase D